MCKFLITACALVMALLSVTAQAARIELAASEIATIELSNSSLSPRVLVKWSLPEILSDKAIEAASVRLTLATEGETPLVVDLMPITTSWAATNVSWNSNWSAAGGDFEEAWQETAVVSGRNGGTVSFNVRHLVCEQIAGNRSNFGFIVVPDVTAQAELTSFQSNAAAKLADAKLIIVYRQTR